MKQFLVIQNKEKYPWLKGHKSPPDEYQTPSIGVYVPQWKEYLLRVDGSDEEYRTQEQIEEKYGETHTVFYFDSLTELAKEFITQGWKEYVDDKANDFNITHQD